jgi:hypothetical protein
MKDRQLFGSDVRISVGQRNRGKLNSVDSNQSQVIARITGQEFPDFKETMI